MNLSLFGHGITISLHRWRRRFNHSCNVKECPVRIPPAEIKYIIVDRKAGGHSKRFDTREDAERALRFLVPLQNPMVELYPGVGKRYEVLETFQVMDTWAICDPEIPESAGIIFFNSKHFPREEHNCASCRPCQVSCAICATCPKNSKEFAPGTPLGDAYDRILERQDRESE